MRGGKYSNNQTAVAREAPGVENAWHVKSNKKDQPISGGCCSVQVIAKIFFHAGGAKLLEVVSKDRNMWCQ